MKHSTVRFSALLSAVLICLATYSSGSAAAESHFHQLTIMVPAGRGGGWDLTAKAIAEVLQQTGKVDSVIINYSPGAGGLIGLAEFISSSKGREDSLMVGGKFMLGAVALNHATVSLLDTTPLARLTWAQAVIAVPSSSKIKSADDLIEAMLFSADSVSWVGGSKGGEDELALLEFARGIGIKSYRLHYSPLPGGGEAAAALMSGKYTVGISGYAEFENLVNAGKLRIIAITSKDPNESAISAPTFADLGIKSEHLNNWRGIFAPPGLNQAQSAVLKSMIAEMVRSPQWRGELKRHRWQDAYLSGKEFTRFVAVEQRQVPKDLRAMQSVDTAANRTIDSVLLRRYALAVGLGVLSVILVGLLWYQRSRARHREEGLQHAYEAATGEAHLHAEELERALAGIYAQIEQAFDSWGLSSAEREIGLLMLKGLRLKEIADARGTSERTVRQQAQAIYKKGGLNGRSELAAYFIEDFMQSMEPRTGAANDLAPVAKA